MKNSKKMLSTKTSIIENLYLYNAIKTGKLHSGKIMLQMITAKRGDENGVFSTLSS